MSIQRALVIGGGSGVGKATAEALNAAGASVLAAGHERDATDHEQVPPCSRRPAPTWWSSRREHARIWPRSRSRAGSRSR